MKVGGKKIRGGKRGLKAIQKWISINKTLDLSILEQQNREYVKFWVKPWSNLVLGNGYKPIHGRLKLALLEGLTTIFNHWNEQLQNLNKPYYLRIWLFEDLLQRSQVVCAINDKIEFYENTFLKNHNSKSFELSSKNSVILRFDKLSWDANSEVELLPENFRALDVYETVQEHKILGMETINNKKYYIIENQRVWVGRSNL